MTILLHRRLSDPRIRATSKTSDIVLLFLLWLQLALGLATIPLSAQHLDGSMMMKLAEWSQRIVTFRSGGVELLADAGWIFKTHMFLGMSIFRSSRSPVWCVWSGFGTLAMCCALPGGACTPHEPARRPYAVARPPRLKPTIPKEHTMSGCGTGGCGCSSTESSQASAPASTLTPTQAAAYEALAASMVDAPVQSAPSSAPSAGAALWLASTACR